MSLKDLETRRAYQRAWARANPEKVRASAERSALRHPEATRPGSDLQYRQGPDGHSLHFRLDIPGKDDEGNAKNIPQVWAEGELGETLFAAGIDPDKLKGEKATVTGLVYGVSFPGRRTFHRMKLTRIEVADLIIPPAEVSPLRVVEPEPAPLDAEIVAELDALEVPWPDTTERTPA